MVLYGAYRHHPYRRRVFAVFNSIRHLPTNVVSFMIFVDPAVAILLDILLSGFKPDSIQILGISLIFIGVVYSLKTTRPTENDVM